MYKGIVLPKHITVTDEMRTQWLTLLRDIPVSVNNFYGDPLIQWDNTIEKLDQLVASSHTGPVGIITKGRLSKKMAETLGSYVATGLKLVVLVSISELYPLFENVPMAHRYKNIQLLNEAGVPAIAYIRPMIPPYNTSPEVIDRIFTNLKANGAKYLVVSGFRGDENIVHEMSPDEQVEWVLRVKQMTGDVFDRFLQNSQDAGIQLFTRTSCGVSVALGIQNYNPYGYSPSLVRCQDVRCPLFGDCGKVADPKPGSIELLQYLGYDAEVVGGDMNVCCTTTGENRLNCPSCCTTCYILNVPHVYINTPVRLGDLTFARFLTGMLTRQRGCNDTGDKDIAKVTLPNFPELEITALNSWWPMATVHRSCFKCQYCILGYYEAQKTEFGFPPAQLLGQVGL